MLMLDLCCGLKGASQAMKSAGWSVLTVDIDERFAPDVVADLMTWRYDGPRRIRLIDWLYDDLF